MDRTADQRRLSVYAKGLLTRPRQQQAMLPFVFAPEPAPPSEPKIWPKTRSSLDLFTGAGGLTLGLHEGGAHG